MFGGFRAIDPLEFLEDKGTLYLNDTWLFDGLTETWLQLSFQLSKLTNQEYPGERSYHSSVALQRRSSRCSCKQSAFMYGGVNRKREVLDDLWELVCLREETGRPIYDWVRHHRNPRFQWPSARYRHQAVYFNPSTMIVWGGSDNIDFPRYQSSHWLYKVSSDRWSKYDVKGYLSFAYDAMAVFHSGIRKVLRIQTGLTHYLDPVKKRWWPLKTALANPALQSLHEGTAVYIDSTVFVFAGIETDIAYTNTRVWSLQETGGERVWLLERFPRDCPLPQMYGSWNKVGDTLVLTPNLPLSLGTRIGYNWLHLLDQVSTVSGNSIQFQNIYNCSLSHWLCSVILDTMGLVVDSEGELPSTGTVWQLDLDTMVWQQYSTSSNNSPTFYTATTRWDHDAIVTFGGICAARENRRVCYPFLQSDLWTYFLKIRKWVKVRSPTPGGPEGRVFPTLSQIGRTSFLLFGGASINEVMNERYNELPTFNQYLLSDIVTLSNDLWILSLSGDGQAGVEANWEKVISTHPPPERIGHQAIVTDSKLVVWGGMGFVDDRHLVQIFCHTDMWYFDINTGHWNELESLGIDIYLTQSPSFLCRPVASVLGNRLVTTVPTNTTDLLGTADPYYRNRIVVFVPPGGQARVGNPSSSSRLVSYFLTDRTWVDHQIHLPSTVDALFTWRNYLVAVKQISSSELHISYNHQVRFKPPYDYQTVISKSRPGCRKGEFSSDWGRERCRPCSKGLYSNDGAKTCDKCPTGLTSDARATSLSECRCDPSYCQQGKCFVTNSDGKLGAECKCDAGFTGGRCQYPTFFIISAACLAGILITILLLVFLQRMIKYRRIKNLRENELQEMGKVWTIESSELEVLGKLDSEAPGSYGDVFKARYRDMVVAVKQLKIVMLSGPIQREFQREIQVMKSVRHPNVVLFLGAGIWNADGCPFLVTEFLQNGSLTSTIRNPEVGLSMRDQIGFCLDTAKGMDFLHNLNPPRIHRDIKSNNLLLSERWVVKVADFGSARMVRSRDNSQPVSRRRPTAFNTEVDATTPLLNPSFDLSRNVGALLWRAPEVCSGASYGTAADVYR